MKISKKKYLKKLNFINDNLTYMIKIITKLKILLETYLHSILCVLKYYFRLNFRYNKS